MSVELSALTAALVLLCAAAYAADEHVAGIDIGAAYEARVRAGIERNRRSPVCIRVTNQAGRPVAGVKVSVKQTSHDFLFGCAFPMWREPPKHMGEQGWDSWNRLFTGVFNYATSENALKWGPLETQEGKPQWDAADFMVRWCRERGITMKGHTLIWAYESHGFPDWLKQYGPEKISSLARQRIDAVIGRYRDRIHIWDVVNEPVHLHWFEEHWTKDYILDSYRWAREADPKATLVINDYAGFRGDVDKFVPMVRGLLKDGAPIDAIGEQAHDPPCWYSPKEVFDTLDKMASTGLRIHLTELTYPSDGREITGGFRHGVWDEENQGRFYRYFLTLCFSHPQVDAITLWAMWDGSSWLKNGGIVRADWTPKPAHDAMDDLINDRWKTRFEAATDANGEVRFRGFHGRYEVCADWRGDRIYKAEMHIRKANTNSMKITVH